MKQKKLLIVVDYQNDFVDGSLGFPDGLKINIEIKNKINKYLNDEQDIIYTLDTHDDKYLESFEGKNLPIVHCIKGTFGHQVVKDCDYQDKAVKVFEKPTFPSLELANYLVDKEYSEVELCGLVSNICVLSNAVMVKAALPNAYIYIDAKATASFDKQLELKCFDVLKGLHIDVINRED